MKVQMMKQLEMKALNDRSTHDESVVGDSPVVEGCLATVGLREGSVILPVADVALVQQLVLLQVAAVVLNWLLLPTRALSWQLGKRGGVDF
jgi:positive regulator of sigma E activity